MFGKIENGRLQIAGRIVKDGKTVITNPTNEQLFKLGYKIVEYTAKPIYNDEEEKLVEEYIDGNNIVVNYEIVALTDEEHNEVIKQKIVAEENKVSARNIRGALLDIEYDKNEINKIENNIVDLRKKLRKVENIEE